MLARRAVPACVAPQKSSSRLLPNMLPKYSQPVRQALLADRQAYRSLRSAITLRGCSGFSASCAISCDSDRVAGAGQLAVATSSYRWADLVAHVTVLILDIGSSSCSITCGAIARAKLRLGSCPSRHRPWRWHMPPWFAMPDLVGIGQDLQHLRNHWPKFASIGQTLGNIGPTLVILSPALADLGQHGANFGQLWATSGRCQLTSTNIWPTVAPGASFRQLGRNFWTTSERFGIAASKYPGHVARSFSATCG